MAYYYNAYIAWCLRAFGNVDKFSFMQYCLAPKTQVFIYSLSSIDNKSIGKISLSLGFISPHNINKFVLWKTHSLVVKYCKSSSPTEIRFCIRTMLKKKYSNSIVTKKKKKDEIHA